MGAQNVESSSEYGGADRYFIRIVAFDARVFVKVFKEGFFLSCFFFSEEPNLEFRRDVFC